MHSDVLTFPQHRDLVIQSQKHNVLLQNNTVSVKLLKKTIHLYLGSKDLSPSSPLHEASLRTVSTVCNLSVFKKSSFSSSSALTISMLFTASFDGARLHLLHQQILSNSISELTLISACKLPFCKIRELFSFGTVSVMT